MLNGTEDQIERLIQAVNEIADLIPTSAESSAELSGQTGAVGGLPLDQLVDVNIGQILGANPSKDPQRIVALLTGAFTKQPRGAAMGDYQWRQRGSVPVDGSDGGQVAGEQATLFQELKDREEAANRLLDATVPVVLGPDEDEINEVKERIRTTISGIVAESGRPGGAVLDRIDVLLQTLGSDLQELKEKLGLDENNPPSEEFRKELDFATAEQIRANFESLETTYIGVDTLRTVRDRLEQANDSPGTRLLRLVRAIEAIPNTVQQAYSVMNSVRFGAAERRVTGVESDNDTTTLEQLFDWIEQSASTDWPASLIGGGARRSEVVAVRLAAERQSEKLSQLTRDNNARLKQLMEIGANRVSTIIAELRRELTVVKDLTAEIAGLVSVQAISRSTGTPAGGDSVIITGVNLQSVTHVLFGNAEATITAKDPAGASINVNTPAHGPGVVDLTVKDDDDTSETLTEAFSYIQPTAPTFKLLSPDRGPAAGGQTVVIIGSNLSRIRRVDFDATDVGALKIDEDGTFIKFQTPGGESGSVAIVVTDANGQKFDTDLEFTYEKSGK